MIEHIQQFAEMGTSVIVFGIVLLKLISPFTRTKKDDKIVEKLKDN